MYISTLLLAFILSIFQGHAADRFLTPKTVLRQICDNHSYGKKWIDEKRGVIVVLANGKETREPGFKVLDSTLFEFIEDLHKIECPAAFSRAQVICRKSAGGEAYRYIFKKADERYLLTQIEIEYQE